MDDIMDMVMDMVSKKKSERVMRSLFFSIHSKAFPVKS